MTHIRLIDTKDDLDEFASFNRYVLVEFLAPSLPECQEMAPVFGHLTDEQRFNGRLRCARINLDEAPDIGENYGIKIDALPAYMVLVDGKQPVESREGEFMLRAADQRALRDLTSSLEYMVRAEDV